MNNLATIILAAGQGKRMKSSIPKVIHRVAGRSLLSFPLALARHVNSVKTVVVVGHGRELVEAEVQSLPEADGVHFALQKEQRGTGHAVMAALGALSGHKGAVLILSGDVPLLAKSSISKLQRAFSKSEGPIAFVSFEPEDPKGYGRVIRDKGMGVAIREDKDCSKEEKAIGEVNAGIYMIDCDFLRKGTKKLRSNNAQGELYLTDLVALASGKSPVPVVKVSANQVCGVNDRLDLANIDQILQEQIALNMMKKGVTIRQPSTVNIDLDVSIGRDTEIGPGVQLHGKTTIGIGCVIEAGAVVRDSRIHDGAIVRAYSVLESAQVGKNASVGPMGRLRPGTIMEEGSRVGNWVELKNTVLGKGSKANHLAYLGDGVVGAGVNVGAGVIFCNYDGVLKHQTVLEDGVFVGSDSQLVAPVTVGKGAYVGSGSTITKDVPQDALAVARSRQVNRDGFARRFRKALLAIKAKGTTLQKGGAK